MLYQCKIYFTTQKLNLKLFYCVWNNSIINCLCFYLSFWGCSVCFWHCVMYPYKLYCVNNYELYTTRVSDSWVLCSSTMQDHHLRSDAMDGLSFPEASLPIRILDDDMKTHKLFFENWYKKQIISHGKSRPLAFELSPLTVIYRAFYRSLMTTVAMVRDLLRGHRPSDDDEIWSDERRSRRRSRRSFSNDAGTLVGWSIRAYNFSQKFLV